MEAGIVTPSTEEALAETERQVSELREDALSERRNGRLQKEMRENAEFKLNDLMAEVDRTVEDVKTTLLHSDPGSFAGPVENALIRLTNRNDDIRRAIRSGR